MHGGTNPGPGKGNQNARTHGIYAKYLSDEEKRLWGQLELGRVDDELRLCRLRLMRALAAEERSKGEPELDSVTETPVVIGGLPVLEEEPIREKTYKKRDYSAVIDRLLARIESLERTRSELLKAMPDEEEPIGKIQIEVVRGKDA